MRLLKTDNGQIYTIEGVTASLILLAVLLLIIQANSLAQPQTEKTIDMKLGVMANDVITCMDYNSTNSWSPNSSSLQSYVENWNGSYVSYASGVPYTNQELSGLNNSITAMLPIDVMYNLNFTYFINYANNTIVPQDNMVITNGEPGDNSMVATRIITINSNDELSDSSIWKSYLTQGVKFPMVVEVRITCWYL